ncbi:MAG: carboxypeptidase-like regulatory domain-containing protein [Deltaproteobacteria bacterium]|nr:carboxypeptidase-like regulatory domain-containing protein [Deltaproteobacteria bacterium]
MRSCHLSIAIFILLLMLCTDPSASQAQEGTITGQVSLTNQEGEVVYGDWIRVFLTSEPIAIPEVDLASTSVQWERQSRINTGHMDFFVNFRQKLNVPGYAVEDKLTRPDGTFTFNRIHPGRYYIVITFPTMIAGYKCAWQTAVDVAGGQSVSVALNNDNLVIPAH